VFLAGFAPGQEAERQQRKRSCDKSEQQTDAYRYILKGIYNQRYIAPVFKIETDKKRKKNQRKQKR
jgi:uracil-DNA glycosylase